MPSPDPTDLQPHDEAEELLPWYATGRLDPADRLRVERHLEACAECREQLAFERALAQEFQSFEPQVESRWSSLKGRIEAQSAGRAPAAPRRDWAGELWAFVTRPAVAAFAAAEVAFVAFASTLLIWLGQPAYHALGSAPPPPTANVLVMFRADATAQDVRDVLGKADASIVGGPTPAGAFLLHVAAAKRPAAIATLRSDDTVQLAEQIDGDSP